MGIEKNVILSVDAVSKKYRQGRTSITALHEVSLSLYKGELLAIVGPSGSGKTTLTHIIGGLVTPSTGEISVGNTPLKKRSDKQMSRYRNERIGFVFQNYSLIPYYSAIENVTMPLVVAGVASHERRERAQKLLRAVGLEKRMDQRADTLSGGERQRVSIARALSHNPDIIIADEPTGSLDSARGNEIMTILEKLCRVQGIAVLMVTHDVALARRADRTIYIRDGHIEKEELR
ncbi:MAG TPA: ABC transporter ATP-binding protein [Candidatus Saccharimonadales bacterium]|nr:ABC transporter ATP-binding protein [Candidatus Saccharimonadales bacterium]